VKITRVRTLVANENPARGGRNWTFVIVETDEGIAGVGEATLEDKEQTVIAAVGDYAPYLIGEDPTRIEWLWQRMYRHGFWRPGVALLTAISAIEHALWDITGKALGVPVYRLLGGACRERVRLYTHFGPSQSLRNAPAASADDAIKSAIDAARQIVEEEGFTALKTGPFPPQAVADERGWVRYAVKLAEAFRDAFGERVDLMYDCHGRPRPAVAVRLARALEPYGLLFLEEPTPPDNVDAMRKVSEARPSIDIATGERLFTKWGFRDLLEKQVVDVIQPDPAHDGGILETRKIAALAESYYVAVAPHNPYGPVATAVGVHLGACLPNFLILEHARSPFFRAVQREPIEIKDGYVELPTRPGLGVELDEAALARQPYQRRLYRGLFDAAGAPVDL
jgi:galactonate dehydratase